MAPEELKCTIDLFGGDTMYRREVKDYLQQINFDMLDILTPARMSNSGIRIPELFEEFRDYCQKMVVDYFWLQTKSTLFLKIQSFRIKT